MNAYVCDEEKLGILLFESLDDDKVDRSLQPIYLAMEGTEMSNKLNSFMDHLWDGFYQGQIRLSRFPGLVNAPLGSVYDITFTGSPAKKMQFWLQTMSRSAGMTVRIAYPGAESRQITVNGNKVEMNQWDESLQQYGEIQQDFCGENRYLGVVNILEFYLKTGEDCIVQVEPRDAIQTLVRMEWTMAEFFDNGGTTSFVDRVAGSLGIHASTIKVVSVYEGSLVVNYEIEEDPDSDVDLEEISERQTEMFATGQMDLGAPILDVEAGETSVISNGVVTAPGYEPITITAGAFTDERVRNEFVPDVDTITVDSITYNNVTIQKEKIIQGKTSTGIEDQGGNSFFILAAAGLIVFAGCSFAIFKMTDKKGVR